MNHRSAPLIAAFVAACASAPRCEPPQGPSFSTEKPRIQVTETRDTGLVRIHVRQTGGGTLRYGASVSVTPDSSSGLVANDTVSTFRVSRPFRLWVRSIGHRQADTVIAPRPGGGVAIDVQLPDLVVGGPPLCIER